MYTIYRDRWRNLILSSACTHVLMYQLGHHGQVTDSVITSYLQVGSYNGRGMLVLQ